jgi:putative hemolysin
MPSVAYFRRALVVALVLVAACTTNATQPNVSMDLETAYCADLGYTLTQTSCVFPDGSKCATNDFYDGECGHKWSYCEQHGGTISAVSTHPDGAVAAMALCNAADGAQCTESSYATTGLCD